MESKHGRIHYCLGAFLTLERLGKLRCLLWRWAQLRCGVESVSPVCVEWRQNIDQTHKRTRQQKASHFDQIQSIKCTRPEFLKGATSFPQDRDKRPRLVRQTCGKNKFATNRGRLCQLDNGAG